MNLLVTGAWTGAKDNIEKLEKMGHSVCFMQIESEELPCDYSWVEGVICNGLFLSHPIEIFNNLKYIQLLSAGFDRVPMDYINEHSIKIFNARGVYSIPMAEFAITGVLQLYKQMQFFAKNQKNIIWKKNRGLMELYGKKVCIVGCGSVGTECAKRFQAFGCNVVGVDLLPRRESNYEKIVAIADIDNELPSADIIIFTLPLTDDTKHMMNKDRFLLLKENTIIVNVSRGAIIDTNAMIEALPKIGGAVLDVFEEEPLSKDNKIWKMKNVIVTPHNSFIGENNNRRILCTILENLDCN